MNAAGTLAPEFRAVSGGTGNESTTVSDTRGDSRNNGNNGPPIQVVEEAQPVTLGTSPEMLPLDKIDSISPALAELDDFLSDSLRTDQIALPEVEFLTYSHFPDQMGHTLSYQGRPIIYRSGEKTCSVLYASNPCEPFRIQTFELKSGEAGKLKEVRIGDFSTTEGQVLFGTLDIICRQIFADVGEGHTSPLGLYRQFEALPGSQHQSPVQTLADLLNQVQGSAEIGMIPSLYAIGQLHQVAIRHKADIAFAKLLLPALEQTLRLAWHLSLRSKSGKAVIEELSNIAAIFSDYPENEIATAAQTIFRRNTSGIHRRRNIATAAHVDSGKTTLTESILFNCGRITSTGRVDSGNTRSDSSPEERARGISINASVVDATWKPQSDIVDAVDISAIDLPGHVEFMSEVLRGLRVADGGLFLIDSAKGVEVQTKAVWAQANKLQLPGLWVINKCDKPSCDYEKSVESVFALCQNALPIQMPVFNQNGVPGFNGCIDLVSMKMVTEGNGKNSTPPKIDRVPEELLLKATSERELLILHLSEKNPVIARYLNAGLNIPENLLRLAIHEATIRAQLYPIVFSSSLKNIGVRGILDAVTDYLPSPYESTIANDEQSPSNLRVPADPAAELCGLVFDHSFTENTSREFAFVRMYAGILKSSDTIIDTRTGRAHKIQRITKPFGEQHDIIDILRPGEIGAVFGLSDTNPGDTLAPQGSTRVLHGVESIKPVVQVILNAKMARDKTRLMTALNQLARIDPSIKVVSENGNILVSALGLLQIEVLQAQIKRRFNIETEREVPQVHYYSAITKPGEFFVKKFDYGHVVADVLLSVEPLARGSGVQIIDDRRNYATAEKMEWIPLAANDVKALVNGVQKTATYGLIPHVPLNDLKVRILWAKFAQQGNVIECLERAASMALRQACENSGLIMLEPIMEVKIACKPSDLTKLQGEFQAREGYVLGINDVADHKEALFRVPLRRIFDLTEGLRKVLGGESTYDERFLEYGTLPVSVAEQVRERQTKKYGVRQH